MSSLIKRELVTKQNKLPVRYLNTASGIKLAYRLLYGIADCSDDNADDVQKRTTENERI